MNANATIIFSKALDLSEETREQFLLESCGENHELRDEVQSLLQAHPKGKALFQDQAAVAEQLLAEPKVPADGPPRTISHYEINEELGSGGMGSVYSGRDLALGRQVAIKLLRENMDVSTKVRLLHEAEASARLQHPGIATFYEGGEADGVAFLAMELVEGETLRKRLDRGPLDVPETLRLGASLLEALGHAHAANILHRDIKPENIMLNGDRVKLLDFGIAKVVNEADPLMMTEPAEGAEMSGWTQATTPLMTEMGQIIGTAGYMSPEQLRGETLDARSDLFAVGVVQYEALTGRDAFPGRSLMERLSANVSCKPLPLDPPDAGTDLDRVIQKAMARDPDDRYPTAAAFLSDLRRIDEVQATAILPDSLAVFDFENLSGDEADAWIGSGIAESLGSDLGQVQGLQVIPREKVVRALAARSGADPGETADLGRGLGCRWILSGSFQRIGPSLRVTSLLRDASTGATFQSEKIDGTLDGIFAIQDRLAESTARALELDRSTSSERTPVVARLQAYEHYAKGRHIFHRMEKGGFDQAFQLYERSIAVDPTYAPALAGLASVYALRWTYTTDPTVLDTALDLATRALDSDPDITEAHLWKAYALLRQRKTAEALSAAKTVMASDPRNFYGPYFAALCYLDLGDFEAARDHAQKCLEIHPLTYAFAVLGWCHLELGDHQEAQWTLEKLEDLRGKGGPFYPGSVLAECLRRRGDLKKAREQCMKALKDIEDTDSMHRDFALPGTLTVLGRIALAQGDLEAARTSFSQAITQLKARPKGPGLGHILVQASAGLAQLNKEEKAFDDAVAAFENRKTFDYSLAPICWDGASLVELHRAAMAIGQTEKAREFLVQARTAGSDEARREPMP